MTGERDGKRCSNFQASCYVHAFFTKFMCCIGIGEFVSTLFDACLIFVLLNSKLTLSELFDLRSAPAGHEREFL